MNPRAWFYLGILIVVGALMTFGSAEANKIRLDQERADLDGTQSRTAQLQTYVSRQTDAFKLVHLAKQLRSDNAEVLQLILDRAYTLQPENRDIALLDSQFHPELAKKVQELDPLYKSKN